MTSSNPVDQDDVEEIWDLRLDGCSIRYIHEFKVSHLSRKAITSILNGPVPERFKHDDRLQPFRYAWISAGGMLDASSKDIAFAILKLARTISQANFRKGLAAIRRDFRELAPSGWLNGYVSEPLEREVAEKFIVKHGYPGWEIDGQGNVTRITSADLSATPSESPKMR